MSDLDAEILALRVAGVSEREVCQRLGCSVDRAHAVLDEHAARKLAPENAERMLVESFDRIRVIERTFTPRAAAATLRL